jgi:hypothetical protein
MNADIMQEVISGKRDGNIQMPPEQQINTQAPRRRTMPNATPSPVESPSNMKYAAMDGKEEQPPPGARCEIVTSYTVHKPHHGRHSHSSSSSSSSSSHNHHHNHGRHHGHRRFRKRDHAHYDR